MATKPTPGGSDGTYGTELNAFLDVSLDADGDIKDGAVFTTSAAPTVDAGVVNKKYVDDGQMMDVNGSPVKVFSKILTGTLDSDSSTVVAHGISSGLTKIMACVVSVFEDTDFNGYVMYDFFTTSPTFANQSYSVYFDGTNVNISAGIAIQGNGYKIKLDFIL